MSKTITIIQLLNKIANEEELPQNIKYFNRNYLEHTTMLCCKENIIDKLDCNSISLNDTVEIIEEQENKSLQDILNDYSITINDFIMASNEFINKLKEKQ